MAELGQRLRLDLADALAGDAKLLADFLERAHLPVVEAEPQPDDGPLTVVELVERLFDRLREERASGGSGRRESVSRLRIARSAPRR